MSSGDSVCTRDSRRDLSRTGQESGVPQWRAGGQKGPHPRCDDDGLEALEHGFDGQRGVHAAVRSGQGW